jgi:hypothetical protein
VLAALVERQALRQFWLAALTIVDPGDSNWVEQ